MLQQDNRFVFSESHRSLVAVLDDLLDFGTIHWREQHAGVVGEVVVEITFNCEGESVELVTDQELCAVLGRQAVVLGGRQRFAVEVQGSSLTQTFLLTDHRHVAVATIRHVVERTTHPLVRLKGRFDLGDGFSYSRRNWGHVCDTWIEWVKDSSQTASSSFYVASHGVMINSRCRRDFFYSGFRSSSFSTWLWAWLLGVCGFVFRDSTRHTTFLLWDLGLVGVLVANTFHLEFQFHGEIFLVHSPVSTTNQIQRFGTVFGHPWWELDIMTTILTGKPYPRVDGLQEVDGLFQFSFFDLYYH
ncbi:hypothetical protein D3C71_1276060 [compost metagenome]